VFVATGSGTGAYRLAGGKLTEVWSNGTGGTSPVIAGGLLELLATYWELRAGSPADAVHHNR